MTSFPIRPCFDVRLQPARPNGSAAVGGQRFEKGQEEAGGGGGSAGRQEIGDWTDACLLFFEAGTHVSERVQ